MRNQPLFDKLQMVFRSVLQDPSLVLYPAMTAREHPGWNSFNHMLLIDAIEKEFAIRFTFEEVRGLKNVGDLAAGIQKKLGSE